jgi:hypothetical protein
MHSRTSSTSGCTVLEQHVYQVHSKGILIAMDATAAGILTGVKQSSVREHRKATGHVRC